MNCMHVHVYSVLQYSYVFHVLVVHIYELYACTVEPLWKDTLYKGHLLYIPKREFPVRPLYKGHLHVVEVPMVSVIKTHGSTVLQCSTVCTCTCMYYSTVFVIKTRSSTVHVHVHILYYSAYITLCTVKYTKLNYKVCDILLLKVTRFTLHNVKS